MLGPGTAAANKAACREDGHLPASHMRIAGIKHMQHATSITLLKGGFPLRRRRGSRHGQHAPETWLIDDSARSDDLYDLGHLTPRFQALQCLCPRHHEPFAFAATDCLNSRARQPRSTRSSSQLHLLNLGWPIISQGWAGPLRSIPYTRAYPHRLSTPSSPHEYSSGTVACANRLRRAHR